MKDIVTPYILNYSSVNEHFRNKEHYSKACLGPCQTFLTELFFPPKSSNIDVWEIHRYNAKDPVTCWENNTSTLETRSNFIWRCFVVLTVNMGPTRIL